MPHDSSKCPFCRWAAERLKATKLWDGEITRWIKNGQIIRSFCTSLDAVAGLLGELCGRGNWNLFWSRGYNKWCMWAYGDQRSPIYSETDDENDYSCVIATAMAVLGDKGSDG